MSEKLKPCPACGANEVVRRFQRSGGNDYAVECVKCNMSGPWGDGSDGAECDALWNALPRRGDSQQAVGMSDGELIARALRDLSDTVADAATAISSCRGCQLFFDADVRAELDRRAAARKPKDEQPPAANR